MRRRSKKKGGGREIRKIIQGVEYENLFSDETFLRSEKLNFQSSVGEDEGKDTLGSTKITLQRV